MPEDHGWNDSPIDGTLQCITCGIWYKLCKTRVPKTHTLLMMDLWPLLFAFAGWLHLSTWDSWHPLTSHDSHPFHITQGIFPSFFSHLQFKTSCSPLANLSLFFLPSPPETASWSVHCSSEQPPWAIICELTLTSVVLRLSRDPLPHPSASQAWGCWVLYCVLSRRPVHRPGEECVWNSLRAKGRVQNCCYQWAK